LEIKRETTLNDAFDTVRLLLDQLQKSRISARDRAVSGDDLVELEIEILSGEGELKLEFEIQWRARDATQPQPRAASRKA
jgi:hypothetical protein